MPRSYCFHFLHISLVAVVVALSPQAAVEAKSTEAPQSSGTGFTINQQGHILTNHHVIANCPSVRVMVSSELREVTVIATDKKNDLAVLKLGKPMSHVARFRKGPGIRSGDDIVVVGFPYHTLLASEANVTTGTVSAMAGLRDDTRFIQITAPVQPGNSGGPVLDKSGNVVGVVESKLNALAMALINGDIPQNVNFAIKDGIARSFLDSHQISYEVTTSDKHLEAAEIGDHAKQFTFVIECHSETIKAKKQRLESERQALQEAQRRAQLEAKRQQEAARKQARIEEEEQLRLARLKKEEEDRLAEQAYQQQKDILDREAAEKETARQNLLRLQEEQLARENMEKARKKGHEARATAIVGQEEPLRIAREAHHQATFSDPATNTLARQKLSSMHQTLPAPKVALDREVEEELKKISHAVPLPATVNRTDHFNTLSFWSRIESIIKMNWEPPPTRASEGYRVTVKFRFFREGIVSGVTIKESSGNSYFDESARRAVLAPFHFPKFPTEMPERYQDVEMVFGPVPTH